MLTSYIPCASLHISAVSVYFIYFGIPSTYHVRSEDRQTEGMSRPRRLCCIPSTHMRASCISTTANAHRPHTVHTGGSHQNGDHQNGERAKSNQEMQCVRTWEKRSTSHLATVRIRRHSASLTLSQLKSPAFRNEVGAGMEISCVRVCERVLLFGAGVCTHLIPTPFVPICLFLAIRYYLKVLIFADVQRYPHSQCRHCFH